MNKLTKRQKYLVEVCKKVHATVDVGCDHGYIGLQLLLENKTDFLIGTDISAPSVDKTRILLEKNNLLQKASIRVGDGLETINQAEQIDQVIIAGMGGLEIVHILENYKQINSIKHFVFQPMNEVWTFRKYLSEHNYKIEQDFVILDKNKYYHIITAEIGKQVLSDFQQKWGVTIGECDYYLWLAQKEQKIKRVINNLPKDSEKIAFFSRCLEDIEQIKKENI